MLESFRQVSYLQMENEKEFLTRTQAKDGLDKQMATVLATFKIYRPFWNIITHTNYPITLSCANLIS
jgi:hypothetical protein